jgi:N6-adenosine-specific RNA methylase IME4
MKYDVIYADPAWTFNVWSDKAQRRAAKHYSVMTLEDIKTLPVSSIANDNSVLVLWCTYPNLYEGFEVGKAWGFKYKTCLFTWVKTNKKADTYFVGMGYYTRANPEIALLFTRGNPLKRHSRSVRNLIVSKIGRHSAKPVEAYEGIERLFGDVSRIELYARNSRPGWTSLGYDIDDRDLRQSIPEEAARVDVGISAISAITCDKLVVDTETKIA